MTRGKMTGVGNEWKGYREEENEDSVIYDKDKQLKQGSFYIDKEGNIKSSD